MFHVNSLCVTSFVSFAFTVCWLTLNRSLFWFYCIWHCLLTRHWFAQCQQHLYIWIVQILLLTLNKSIRLFFTWLLCIYDILDNGWRILYAFGLNSTVCSHMVGVHLSSDQVIYDFMMNANLYNSFYCVYVSKVSSNLQYVLIYDTIF